MAEKSGNIAIIYGAIALLSLLLLIGYLLWEKKKEKNFIVLFSCISAVNCGYFLQSLADTLEWAMMANRLSYLGAAYSMLAMLLIITDVCQIRRAKWMTGVFVGISTLAFMLAASGDWLGLYYRAVSIESVNGMTRLVKLYGPLHILYPVYLLSYFALMAAAILRARSKNTLSSPKYAAFLIAVALSNLFVWGVEQFIYVDFEFLSVSYIASEVMLLAIYTMLRDYGIIQSSGRMVSAKTMVQMNAEQSPAELPADLEQLFDSFAQAVTTLTSAERRILNYYIKGCEITDIPDLAFISINTVKKHNRSIYHKLNVASRDELMLYIEQFRRWGRLDELTGAVQKA